MEFRFSLIVECNLQARRGIAVDPSKSLKDLRSGEHVMQVRVAQLYLLMGRELEALDEVPAGNIVGTSHYIIVLSIIVR